MLFLYVGILVKTIIEHLMHLSHCCSFDIYKTSFNTFDGLKKKYDSVSIPEPGGSQFNCSIKQSDPT